MGEYEQNLNAQVKLQHIDGKDKGKKSKDTTLKDKKKRKDTNQYQKRRLGQRHNALMKQKRKFQNKKASIEFCSKQEELVIKQPKKPGIKQRSKEIKQSKSLTARLTQNQTRKKRTPQKGKTKCYLYTHLTIG